jgi:hypothetical protein
VGKSLTMGVACVCATLIVNDLLPVMAAASLFALVGMVFINLLLRVRGRVSTEEVLPAREGMRGPMMKGCLRTILVHAPTLRARRNRSSLHAMSILMELRQLNYDMRARLVWCLSSNHLDASDINLLCYCQRSPR